ncbi:pre-mRNA-processing factor 39-like [Rhopalosiphum maidis]|uniref:pre-mRNA-processing factor 39-like n=1 Tax=Rhopalosiphum maidis TaxID=43146 RepID=UPI000F0020AF|nr:pre-mRNA-processing factor 39-like [Rhopalosiphum maidis]
MPDQKQSINLQKKSNTTLNEESRKIAAKLKSEDKTSIEGKSKHDEEMLVNNQESVGNTKQKLENQVFSDKASMEDDDIYNKESVDGELIPEDKICIVNKPRAKYGPSFSLQINNQESGECSAKFSLEDEKRVNNKEPIERNSKNLLEGEKCINNKSDSEDGLPPTTIVEKHQCDILPCSLKTLSTTVVDNRKRYQNQNEDLDKNEPCSLKKIKIEKTCEYQFQQIWKHLERDPSNFKEWTHLLNVIDYQNIEVNSRMAYSKFLELYPLCYGYWKKYANFEKRINNIHGFKKVLENSLSSIPISVDLWTYYMSYLRLEHRNEEDLIRKEFERSLKMCGLDYRSDKLWHDYISWEVEKNEIFNAVNIYYRLIRIPTSNYLKNFFKFQEFIFKNLPEKCLGLAEFTKRRNIIIESHEQILDRNSFVDDSIPPGEDSLQITEYTENSIMSILRIDIIESWYNIHKQTAKEFESRKKFEENIRRTHFHVKELESNQIKNWENYIKFEKKSGNHERIIFLYERCLITCVSNEGLWLNYLEYLSFVNLDVNALLVDVFKRSLFHHPKSLLLNLKYFDFSENKGWIEKAIETITKLGIIYPNSRDVTTRIMHLARRKEDETLKILFKHHLNCSQTKSFSNYVAVKYARFVWKHDRQLNLALDILNDTIRKNNSVNNSGILRALIFRQASPDCGPK